MAITYFNSAAVPADDGSNATTTITITPPGSMQAGDLVILIATRRNASSTIAITTTGGQTWNEVQVHQSSTAVLTAGFFWCRYNGTWNADPVVTFNAGTNTSVVMHVFRPTSSSKQWAVEYFFVDSWVSYAGNEGDVQQAVTTHNDVVALGVYTSDDDNTWGNPTNGYVVAGSAQYRNTAGQDTSIVTIYKIYTTTQPSVVSFGIDQLTLGVDPGEKMAIGFYEFDEALPIPNKIYQKNQAVNRAAAY